MTLEIYCPEMGQAKPKAQIEAHLAHYGKHYFLYTPLTLPGGRGIELLKTYRAEDLVPGSHKIGWNYYKVTIKAFRAICEKYAVSYESLLD